MSTTITAGVTRTDVDLPRPAGDPLAVSHGHLVEPYGGDMDMDDYMPPVEDPAARHPKPQRFPGRTDDELLRRVVQQAVQRNLGGVALANSAGRKCEVQGCGKAPLVACSDCDDGGTIGTHLRCALHDRLSHGGVTSYFHNRVSCGVRGSSLPVPLPVPMTPGTFYNEDGNLEFQRTLVGSGHAHANRVLHAFVSCPSPPCNAALRVAAAQVCACGQLMCPSWETKAGPPKRSPYSAEFVGVHGMFGGRVLRLPHPCLDDLRDLAPPPRRLLTVQGVPSCQLRASGLVVAVTSHVGFLMPPPTHAHSASCLPL